MDYANFHTHCLYCDGDGEPEEYIKRAIDLGFLSIGFSSHAPLPFLNEWSICDLDAALEYCDKINDLKKKYEGKIQIYLGMEADYFSASEIKKLKKIKGCELDYIIGSVHYIKNDENEYFGIDSSEEEYVYIIEEVYKSDIKKFVHDYYCLVKRMIQEYKPNIVGHIDLIKKNNKGEKYFREDEGWYIEEVKDAIKAVAQSGAVLEVNTGGISRRYIDTFYPSLWILKECKKLDIPVVISSDAHTPYNINAYFNEADAALKSIGYSTQRILIDGIWKDVKL